MKSLIIYLMNLEFLSSTPRPLVKKHHVLVKREWTLSMVKLSLISSLNTDSA